MASVKTHENEKVLENVKGITFLPFQSLLSFSLAQSRKTEDREKEERRRRGGGGGDGREEVGEEGKEEGKKEKEEEPGRESKM
jgi:hypothetical protein